MSFDPEPYAIGLALLHWLTVLGGCLGLALLVALLTSLVAQGFSGPLAILRELAAGTREMLRISGRRVGALARLTWKEAIRRKVLAVFVIFAAIFMFAGWFISGANERPALQVKDYVSFVLTTIRWLVLPVALLLACWGIPEDIRRRSLHTVVTKPARRNEIVIGRMLGYIGVATLVLAVFGAVGWMWIKRQVPADVEQQALICRVPIYGRLNFLDREGNPTEQGVNVGDVWEFRSYIEGATKARAIWQFAGITPGQMTDIDPDPNQRDMRLRLESQFEAFRTHKGTIGEELLCQYTFVNEEKDLRVPYPAFEIDEFGQNVVNLSRNVSYFDEEAEATRQVDLFDDLVVDRLTTPSGEVRENVLQVEVQCLNAGQYLGMARPDFFVRTPDRQFWVGFSKALLGIWLMMVLVVVLGVTASCFLKGPVAALLIFTLFIVGLGFRDFMGELITGQFEGGGPVESVCRIIWHMNPREDLGSGPLVAVMKTIDQGAIQALWLAQQIIPNFGYYRMAPYVANGFDVSWNAALLPSIAVTAAYVLPCLLIGYYSLKLRELEAK